jgi:UTP--glucose-1-phosphate uridylyltransferase
MIKKAIILAAGYGTRFLPATKTLPKEMLPVVDKPVIQYVVEEAVQSGIKEVILVTSRGKKAIEDHFDWSPELEAFLEERGKSDLAQRVREISSLASFVSVRQKEMRGTADAVLAALPVAGDEPVAVMSADDIIDTRPPALRQLVRVYEKYRAPVVALRRIPAEETYKYGVVVGKRVAPRLWRVSGSVEKPPPGKAPSDLMIIVKYVLTPAFFPYLRKVKPVNGEMHIPPAIEAYVKSGGRFYGYEVKGDYYDCGGKFGYLQAMLNFALKHPEIGKQVKAYLKGIH